MNLSELFSPVILGLVEGATEFLPVSSTAHLILVDHLLGSAQSASFEIAMQFGAILAVVIFEWRTIWNLLRTAFLSSSLNLALAFIPAAVVGLAFHDFITEQLFSLSTIAITLTLGGVAMFFAESYFDQTRPDTKTLADVNWRQALTIGVCQIISLIPGTSRALSTIYGGLIGGLSRETATEFSFLLAVPVLGAASVYEVFLNEKSHLTVTPSFWIASTVSFFAALLALNLFLNFVKKHNFRLFALYRIMLGIGIGIWLWLA